MPGFDWRRAAKSEWHRRNAGLFGLRRQFFHFYDETIARALKLIESKGDATVLDPLPLREKYEAVTCLADFAARYVVRLAGKPLQLLGFRPHRHLKPTAAHALLALSALLLFKNDWGLGEASADFAMLAALPSAADGTEGNVIGLNPFHDYPAWEVIDEARKVAAARIDVRPVSEQISEIEGSMRAAYAHWAVGLRPRS